MLTAERMAELVDELLGKHWNRRTGEFIEPDAIPAGQAAGTAGTVEATCSCGSGIPVQKVMIDGQKVTLVALPLIFEQFREAGKPPSDETARELLDTVKIYNPIPAGTKKSLCRGAAARICSLLCEKGAAQ